MQETWVKRDGNGQNGVRVCDGRRQDPAGSVVRGNNKIYYYYTGAKSSCCARRGKRERRKQGEKRYTGSVDG